VNVVEIVMHSSNSTALPKLLIQYLDVQLTVHCAKNLMHKSLKKIKVPLILGVWGGKGQGKTFQVTLAFKAMKADPIIMSAGELEAGNAGEPAKLVRQRYREAGTFSIGLLARFLSNLMS
jgi:hypothetical protein